MRCVFSPVLKESAANSGKKAKKVKGDDEEYTMAEGETDDVEMAEDHEMEVRHDEQSSTAVYSPVVLYLLVTHTGYGG